MPRGAYLRIIQRVPPDERREVFWIRIPAPDRGTRGARRCVRRGAASRRAAHAGDEHDCPWGLGGARDRAIRRVQGRGTS